MKPLKFASGITIGADHIKLRKNGQDSLMMVEKKEFVVGVVTDGCGDGIDSPYSEVGSRIGATTAANYIAFRLESTAKWRWDYMLHSKSFWDSVQQHILNRIEDTARGMGGNFSKNVIRHFLFTIVGMIITPDLTLFFGSGDGYYFLNEMEYPLLVKDEKNMPPYLAYNLVETDLKKMSAVDLRLRVRQIMSTDLVSSAMVATDGIEWISNFPEKIVPGTSIPVGQVNQFWINKDYYENPTALDWRLNLLATDKKRIDWKAQELEVQPAILKDDLAIVVASRI